MSIPLVVEDAARLLKRYFADEQDTRAPGQGWLGARFLLIMPRIAEGAPMNAPGTSRLTRRRAAREQALYRLFELGVWVKGIDGILEICGGVLLLLTSPAALNRLVMMLTQHELVEDPQDR